MQVLSDGNTFTVPGATTDQAPRSFFNWQFTPETPTPSGVAEATWTACEVSWVATVAQAPSAKTRIKEKTEEKMRREKRMRKEGEE
ncbi:hypothetical protein EBT31_04395 [bacterium]|nr:hypothetical protein [bacterium]